MLLQPVGLWDLCIVDFLLGITVLFIKGFKKARKATLCTYWPCMCVRQSCTSKEKYKSSHTMYIFSPVSTRWVTCFSICVPSSGSQILKYMCKLLYYGRIYI